MYRAMKVLGVAFALLTETKVTRDIYTRHSSGYDVIATNAISAHQGGVVICWRKSDAFEVEETRTWGPNIITTHLVTGQNRCYVVGGYIPPSDLTTLAHIQKAWDQCPKGCIPLFLGDLNINLEPPWDERDEQIAEECNFWELADMSRNFRQRHRHRAQGRWTWQMRQGDSARISGQVPRGGGLRLTLTQTSTWNPPNPR